MPTIVQINTVINTCSTGKIAEDIGKMAIANGWKSYMAFGRNERPSELSPIKIGNWLSVCLHVFMTRMLDKHGLCSYFSTKRFIKKLEKLHPDIIHIHNIHGYYINIKLLFEWIAKNDIPLVWTLHDCWSYTGHCAYYSYVQCDRWRIQCNSCPNKHTYPQSIFLSNAKRNFELKKKYFTSPKTLYLVTPSEWLGAEVKASFLNKYPLCVIHNGIDLSIFYPRNAYSDKHIILGVASVWEKRKGFDDFLKLSKLINANEVIVLVGLTEKQVKKLPANIIGYTRTENQNELAELYSKATVFVNPTYEDNFPTTNLEALACGTPVITYDTDGSPETISDTTGYVVKKGDVLSIYQVISKIENDGKLRYRNECVNRAKDLYDKCNNYLEYWNLYNQLIKTREK